MSKTKIDCEQAVCLSQELFHAHFAGEPEKWFSYLSPDSIYLGTGEPALFGRDAIQARILLLPWSAARSWSRTSERLSA